MNMHKGLVGVGLAALCMLFTGCADHIAFTLVTTHEQVGFWYGVWHGAVLPIAWLNSLFDPDVAIYAIYNNGVWYNTGYLVGVGSLVLSAVSLNSYKYRQ